ncbi:MAG: hypothetical protein JO002_16555, partial [Burkholderiaceae bacterium]|nr:hypothetical protein [Burkholderiaceae bacterium]
MKVLALLGAVLLCCVARSEPLPAGVKQVTATDGITEYRLGNGLKVLL